MVSLLIPCYNSEKYLDRCLKSVLAQTDRNIELILVNDGSTDSSEEIIQKYFNRLEKSLTKFHYIKQENQGVGAACNRGFKYVTGKYLILLDTDDYLFPEAIEKYSQFLDSHPNFTMVRGNGYYVNESNPDKYLDLLEVNSEMKTKVDVFLDLFRGTTYVWPGTYMIRMDVLDSQYPNRNIYPSRSGQNLQFLLVAAYKNKSGFIDFPLMNYTIRNNSLSHFSGPQQFENEMRAMRGYRDIRENLISTIIEYDDREWLNVEMDKLYNKIFFELACKYKKVDEARSYLEVLKLNKQSDLNDSIKYIGIKLPLLPYIYENVGKLKNKLARFRK